MTLFGCPAQVIGQTAYDADLQLGALADTLAIAAPELIVIVGGFDNPDVTTHAALLELCSIIGQVLAYTAPLQRPGVIYAGNRWAGVQAVGMLQVTDGGVVEVVETSSVHRRAAIGRP